MPESLADALANAYLDMTITVTAADGTTTTITTADLVADGVARDRRHLRAAFLASVTTAIDDAIGVG